MDMMEEIYTSDPQLRECRGDYIMRVKGDYITNSSSVNSIYVLDEKKDELIKLIDDFTERAEGRMKNEHSEWIDSYIDFLEEIIDNMGSIKRKLIRYGDLD